MTFETENRQYEALSNMRTLTPYGELQIKEIDEKIARLERSIATEQERRREVIDRYGLNKCQGGLLKGGVSYVVGEQPFEEVITDKCREFWSSLDPKKLEEMGNAAIDSSGSPCASGIHAYELGSENCTLCGRKQHIDDQHSHLCD